MDNKDMRGTVALITGASSGIGEATALALAAQGAKVALAARRMDRLDALARRIAETGSEALPLACDMADEGQVRNAVKLCRTSGDGWMCWSTTRVCLFLAPF